VGNVRRVDPADPVPAQLQDLAVGQRTRGPRGHVVHRDHGGNLAADGLGGARSRQELVESPAFVGFDMGEADVAQALDRRDSGYGLAHEREEPPGTRVEQQRLLIQDEVLVECEAAGQRGGGRADPVDPLGDLVDPRS
jgi:hypothetical protein